MNIGSGGLAGVTKKVPGSIKLSKIPKKVEKLELNPINLSKDMPNSLENTAWKGVKPNGVARAIEEINKTIKRKTKRPIKIRTTETGETVIEDGRHLLEGLRIMGVKKWPVQDVTAMYNPDLVKTARANVKYLRDKAGRYAGSKSLKTPTGKVNINQILNSIKKKRKF